MSTTTMAKRKTHFGDRLRMLRKEHELTLAALAERAGIHLQSLARIERGEQKPSWETVVALARALNVEVAEFLTDEERGE